MSSLLKFVVIGLTAMTGATAMPLIAAIPTSKSGCRGADRKPVGMEKFRRSHRFRFIHAVG
jgi:hypothetical protein